MQIFCKRCRWRFARRGTKACKKHKCANQECIEARCSKNAFCRVHGDPFESTNAFLGDSFFQSDHEIIAAPIR